MMRLQSEGGIKSIDDLIELCTIFSRKSSYNFCLPIKPVHHYGQYHKVLCFHITSIQQSQFPFSWVYSVNCELCFLPASNTNVVEKAASEVKYTACKYFVHDLNCKEIV